VRLWALNSFWVRFWALTSILGAPLRPHPFSGAFSNPISFWVRLWALISILSAPLSPHLHFECAFEPSSLR
jgi:hypothetical protein